MRSCWALSPKFSSCFRNELAKTVLVFRGSVGYPTLLRHFCPAQPQTSVLMQPSARKRPVVLIEDEFLVRMGTRAAVETAGFDVVEAGDADEAIAILAARSDIRLIFTDIHMPGSMDGLKLAHFVRDRWPPVKIVATSARVRVTAGELPEGGRFVPKPYSAAEITATLHELIQG
jgi:CheY-like chemotaxis protein